MTRLLSDSIVGIIYTSRTLLLLMTTSRIGYLVPEFPGQTHIFFWREIEILDSMGLELDLVSTSPPVQQLMAHAWSRTAQERTTYLFPPRKHLAGSVATLLRSGPQAWSRCWQVVRSATDLTAKQTLRLGALILMGAELAYLAQQREWRHVHVHSCGDAANVALFAHVIAGVSYSLTLHGPLKDYGPNQAQKWHHAAFGLVITQKLYQEVQTTLAGHLPDDVRVVPMGVNTDQFSRHGSYTPWPQEGECRLFSCGRLNYCKGHAFLIEAVHLLKQEGIPVQLTIAGEDEQGGLGYHQTLQEHINQLELQDSVTLLGAVPESQVRQGLEEAHVFSLVSIEEPLGVAIMEAMAMEVPVVATHAGGVKELVHHEQDGLLVDPGNAQQTAEAIKRILMSPELAIRLGQAGRMTVLQQFRSQRSAEMLVEGVSATARDESAT